jgi:hypothetical protein
MVMTVCIAAICEGGKSIAVAADRMFTNPGLSVEFETAERKIEDLASRCIAMAAGDSVFATEVLAAVRHQLGGNPSPPFDQAAELVRSAYENVRSRKVYQTVIAPVLGADFERLRAAGMSVPSYLEKQPMVFQQMVMMSQQFNPQTDFLVAGVDDAGAHLSHVTNPGVLSQLQKLGHAAIGSGGIHALTRLSLLGQSRQRGLVETLADVYSAKRAAEVAPGVGNATDLAVIDAEHGVWFCTDPVREELDGIHNTVSARESPNLDALRRILDEQWKKPKPVRHGPLD